MFTKNESGTESIRDREPTRSTESIADNSKAQNQIAQGTKITGDIVAQGRFRIEGNMEGTLKTSGTVILAKTGVIDGKIECKNADFEGKFSGNLLVSETLTLRATADIDGDVSVGKLTVEPGATFNATCTMKGGVKSLKDERRKEPIEKRPEQKETSKNLGT